MSVDPARKRLLAQLDGMNREAVRYRRDAVCALIHLMQMMEDDGWDFDTLLEELNSAGFDHFVEHINRELQDRQGEECAHEWINADNEYVSGTDYCPKCGAVQGRMKGV